MTVITDKFSRAVLLILILVFSLFSIPGVIAPSHPVDCDFETGTCKDQITGEIWEFPDPGTTPDSLFYGFELWAASST